LPQDQVFRFQRCSRLEARSQDTENQLEQIGHQDASLRRPLAASTPDRIFGTHKLAYAFEPIQDTRKLSRRSMSRMALGQVSHSSELPRDHHQLARGKPTWILSRPSGIPMLTVSPRFALRRLSSGGHSSFVTFARRSTVSRLIRLSARL
jgi:hypothetical protein